MTFLSLCLKLYMLNILQHSKLRPLCVQRNQEFPFITRPTSSTSTILAGIVTPLAPTAGVATTRAVGGVTITAETTLTAPTVTTAGTVQTTTLSTNLNTRISRNVRRLPSEIGPQTVETTKRKRRCPKIDYCTNDDRPTRPNCPCFDRRTSKLTGRRRSARACVGPEDDIGVCRKLKNCPRLVGELKTQLIKRQAVSSEEILTLHKCKLTDLICCPIGNH